MKLTPLFLAYVIALAAPPGCSEEMLPPGHRARPHGAHALVGARVVVRPGEVIESGTILIDDGLIREVGTTVKIPADARVWDLAGATIYAGFIDCALDLGGGRSRGAADEEAHRAADARDQSLTAGGFFGSVGDERDPGAPGPGYGNRAVTPEARVADDLSPGPEQLAKLREHGFTSGCAIPGKGIFRGTSAFLMLSGDDPNRALVVGDVFQHIAFDRGGAGQGAYPGSLMGTYSVIRQAFLDAQHYARDHADYRARARQRARPPYDPALAALQPALAGERRVVFECDGVLTAYRAGRIAAELGLDAVLLGNGEEWRRVDLLPGQAPLILPLNFPELPTVPEDDDWDQVSLDQLRRWDWAPQNPAVVAAGGHDLALTTSGLPDIAKFRGNLQLAVARGLAADDALAALTTTPARLAGLDDRLGTVQPGRIANLTVVTGGTYFDDDARVSEVWIDGRRFPSPPETKKDQGGSGSREAAASAKPSGSAGSGRSADAGSGSAEGDVADSKERESLTARAPTDGRGPLAAPRAVIVRSATVWTCGAAGRLEDADLLVVDGKIAGVGRALTIPPELAETILEIDGKGRQVTPGLIDCHSHAFVAGGVNEGTLPSSAMVRIADVVNSETEHIYRQLAGGLTASNLLHGSANPIGGQNAVVKLRWGATPDEMLFEGAPSGIKFALGENVKQSNWGEKFTTRFPQSRMGVQAFFVNRFEAARQYLNKLEQQQREGGLPPRRDLELEAIGEILRGTRLIHCHSYRQDEILMLLRVAERYGVRIATFQHVLEGYKVADEIAAHGAGGSCFSDWWAYKFEVYDAIPYAGALMRERGVVVSFNSDSADVARRMNMEAAKAVRYGDVPEEDALNFVVLNPARQLGIDSRVGSLETGKDGDFVIWSGSPLSTASLCLETWIEGRKLFDRSLDAARTGALTEEREALLAKARRAAKGGDKKKGDAGPAKDEESGWRFFTSSLETALDCGVDVHCLGESACDGHETHGVKNGEKR